MASFGRLSSGELLDHDDDVRGGVSTAWDGDFWVDSEAEQQLGSIFEVSTHHTSASPYAPLLAAAQALIRAYG